MKFKKCLKCGALVKVIEDCNCGNCGIRCCSDEMSVITPNVVDASYDKHVPMYELVEDEFFVKVNHPMDKDHYIMWIAMEKDDFYCEIKLYPESEASCCFKYIPGAKLYVYCNKHELWMSLVK